MSDLPLPEPVPAPEVLDIQHDTDPARDEGPARHIPHLGHAVLFFMLAAISILICGQITGTILHISTREEALRHPLAGLVSEGLSYAVTLGASAVFFRILWQRSFARGISWTARAVRRYWWQLILVGFALSGLSQLADHFMPTSDTETSRLLQTRLSAWIFTLFGPTLAPLMEEVAFRGFLLSALATAYDWLTLERTPAGLTRWQQSTEKSRAALVFGAVFSSIGFALLHMPQLHGAKGPVAVLFVTSLAFSAVYIRFRSVAASTLVHVAYNGLIFLQLVVQSGGYRHLDKIN